MTLLTRWLAGLLSGCVAAGFLFWLAALVAGTSEADALGLLALGFGLAFFPVVFVLGTRSPRQVLRRAFVALALEGLLVLFVQTYPLVAGSRLIDPTSFGWLHTLRGLGGDIAKAAPGVTAVVGAIAFVLSLVLFFNLRGRPGQAPASAPATASLPSVTEKTSALKPAPDPKALPDEDARLMADLENLRKKLPK